jgi:septum formation protein
MHGADSVWLASRSPRRIDLLRARGIHAVAMPADINEERWPGEPPARHVRRLAVTKALVVGAKLPAGIVIGGDTVVALDEDILGKPVNRAAAEAMLRRLSGRSHQVLTGVCVWDERAKKGLARVAVAIVSFRELTVDEIRDYVATGEPMDKAGGYAIQGHARSFVRALHGDVETVIGLPTTMVRALMTRLRRLTEGGSTCLRD